MFISAVQPYLATAESLDWFFKEVITALMPPAAAMAILFASFSATLLLGEAERYRLGWGRVGIEGCVMFRRAIWIEMQVRLWLVMVGVKI